MTAHRSHRRFGGSLTLGVGLAPLVAAFVLALAAPASAQYGVREPAARAPTPKESRPRARSVAPAATAPSAPELASDPASSRGPRVVNEILIELSGTPSQQEVQALASRHRLQRIESRPMPVTGSTFYRWRVPRNRPIAEVVRQLEADPAIRSAQPNYVYLLQQAPGATVTSQYALAKLHLPQAHGVARGERVLVAVIDSGVDSSHPDLAGAVVEEFDAVAGGQKTHPHGTAIAGIIAGRGRLAGAAPGAQILAVRAFGGTKGGSDGTTFAILKGLDYALGRGARIVNMSFAGPSDPALSRVMAAARAKGAILIAAAGNAGPKSPPLFPAADPNVISVTATDAEDAIFSGANRGGHIDIAAPGVGILAPAPGAGYQISSGTSFAAAYVSGVAALLLERRPKLTPDSMKRILLSTASDLGPKGRDNDFGNGLVDALRAVRAFDAAPETVAADESDAR